jgi:type IV pilus assembly protein PilM
MPRLLMPRAAGVDISDSSIKWLTLESFEKGLRVQTYGDIPIPPGIVQSGLIKDIDALALELKKVRKELRGIACAHAALPEEAAYVFSMQVPPETTRAQILGMIEFEFEGRVPITPDQAVFDYSTIARDESSGTQEISVVVFPRDIAEAYVDAFKKAGITLLSLEVEARSIARAVSSSEPDEPITLLVDFGRARTGFTVVKRGLPIFTSTVEVGGDLIDRILVEKLNMSHEDAERFKNDEGLFAIQKGKSPQLEAVSGAAAALADEVARHHHYWDTRRNERGERMTPVGRVILVGGNSNLRGLSDYISGRVQAKALRGNVWRHIADFNDYIPPIDKHNSLQYATAIGLALRGI